MIGARTTLFGAALLFGIAGCGGPEHSDAAAGSANAVSIWRISDAPAASIGVVDGDEDYQFLYVTAAWKDPTGRLVVLDGGRSRLSFYDSTGAFLFGAGRRGAGPGEFERLASGWPYRGDSIVVFDRMRQRVSVFEGSGTFSRSFNSPIRYQRRPGIMAADACCELTGSLADGSFIARLPDQVPVGPGDPRFGTATLIRLSPDGVDQEPIGTYQSALYSYDAQAPTGVAKHEGAYPFRQVVVGDTIFGSNGLADGLLVLRSPFKEADTIPLPGSAEPFTPELRAVYERELRTDYASRGGRRYEGSLESNVPHLYSPVVPRFMGIKADADGHLWLERWTPRYGRIGSSIAFDVLSTSGSRLATIELPVGSRFLWAGGKQVMLLERDSLDVQYVRLYEISTDEITKTN